MCFGILRKNDHNGDSEGLERCSPASNLNSQTVNTKHGYVGVLDVASCLRGLALSGGLLSTFCCSPKTFPNLLYETSGDCRSALFSFGLYM